MAELELGQPIVLDNGTGLMKCGFAGAERPDHVFSSLVGRPKHLKAMASAVDDDFFVGKRASELKGILKLSWPIRHGIVANWEDMEHLWHHCYSSLGASQEEHPVLLSEAPLNPRNNRERLAEVFFEKFDAPALHIAPQSILSLYASGKTTGVVLDSGDGVTHVVPVYEGFAIEHAVERIDVAGRDITEYLQRQLRKSGHVFHTSAELETVRRIKEEICDVSQDLGKEEKHDPEEHRKAFELPDGRVLHVGNERFRAPEILFRPDLIGLEYDGVHTILMRAIEKSDLDVRRELISRVLLSGGSTMFPSFGSRLLKELNRLAPSNVHVKIFAPRERVFSSWIGGSILSSLETFKRMWVDKKQYKEHGPNIVHRKAF